jgi:membrane protease YdiL (CAAX protease family)
MKINKTLFLKITICILAILTLLLGIFWLPHILNLLGSNNTVYIELKKPIIILVYATIIPFFIVLKKAFKLLQYIEKGIVFSNKSVDFLKAIKYSGLIIGIIYSIGLVIFLINSKMGLTGYIIIAILIFASVNISVFASVMEEILENGYEIKSENDLTI